MSKEITPEQIECLTGGIKDAVGNIVRRGKLLAATTAKGLITARIFNDGKNADDQEIKYPSPKGKREGAYSATHARTRKKRTAQIGYVDLQLTDRLFNSIQVIDGAKGAYLGILPGKRSDGKISNQELAGFLEENYNQPIFEPTDEEVEKIVDAVTEDAVNEIDKIINKCL